MSQQPQVVKPTPSFTITGLMLFEATRFNNSDSVNVTSRIAGGPGSPTDIVPAKVVANGSWRTITGEERADGFGLTRMANGVPVRGFVPWAAVKEVIYGVE